MRVLVTGGLGRLGRGLVDELSSRGHRVRVFDVPTSANRKRAVAAPDGGDPVDVVWGDLRRADDVEAAVAGQEAVIHAGAVLAPASEVDPDRTHAVNVGGTGHVIDAARRQPRPPVVVFPSSVSTYGAGRDRPPRRVDDEQVASDAYSASKIEAEALVAGSGLDWSIVRVGVSVWPGDRQGADRTSLRQLLAAPADNHLEWIHPLDLAVAFANLLERPDARGRILNLGGGPSCQVTMEEFMNANLSAAGLGPIPREAFGDVPYYTDWMDTAESQALLGYQRHTFADFRVEGARRQRLLRWALTPLRRPITAGLLRAAT